MTAVFSHDLKNYVFEKKSLKIIECVLLLA